MHAIPIPIPVPIPSLWYPDEAHTDGVFRPRRAQKRRRRRKKIGLLLCVKMEGANEDKVPRATKQPWLDRYHSSKI